MVERMRRYSYASRLRGSGSETLGPFNVSQSLPDPRNHSFRHRSSHKGQVCGIPLGRSTPIIAVVSSMPSSLYLRGSFALRH